MKVKFILSILILIDLHCFAQVSFEKGYFIGSDNQRVECLIKDSDWDNCPKEFKFKLTETDDPKKAEITGIKEFGIYGVVKFIGAAVKIDRSTRLFSNYSDIKEPIWSDEQLFLKVILEGKASLYSYVEADLRFYFYSVNDSAIKQLVHKEYKIDNSKRIYFDQQNPNSIATNNEFRLQLWNEVRCNDATISSVEKLNYKQTELVNYFNTYNTCSGSTVTSYVYKQKRDFFNLRLKPGLNLSSFRVESLSNDYVLDFNNKISLSVGAEAEFILPFNKNKWGLVFDPTFKSFNSETESSLGKVTIEYSSIELPFGLRYYCFLNKGIKLFFNGFMIAGHTLNLSHSIRFEYPFTGMIDIKSPPPGIRNFAMGAGVNYKRYSAEIRYYTTQNPLLFNSMWTSEYKRIMVIIGFNFL